MTPAQARYRMRKARYTRAAKGGIRPGWYYIEDEGVTVIGATTRAGTVQVRLTWKQIEQALALKRAAKRVGVNGDEQRK